MMEKNLVLKYVKANHLSRETRKSIILSDIDDCCIISRLGVDIKPIVSSVKGDLDVADSTPFQRKGINKVFQEPPKIEVPAVLEEGDDEDLSDIL